MHYVSLYKLQVHSEAHVSN